MHNDQERNTPLDDVHIVAPQASKTESDSSDITWKKIVQKAQTKSATGPSGISYIFYKKCPKVL